MSLKNMNLKLLSDDELIRDTKNLTGEERRITSPILKHLGEIERRRLFAGLGFSSLFDYCVKGLGYSASSAYRRIEAMRLIKAVPEVEKKIESGAMSLAVASQVQKFFRQEAIHAKTHFNITKEPTSVFNNAKKIEILQKLEGKSARTVEQELFALSSEPVKIKHYEKQRAVSAQFTEVSFLADAQLLKDLEKVKGLLANYNLKSLAEVIAKMTQLSIEKLDPSLKKIRACKSAVVNDISKKNDQASGSTITTYSTSETEVVNSTTKTSPQQWSRYIPINLKKQLWIRDNGQCSYIDPKTKRKCGSAHRLEVDHIIPYACGGQTSEENLRLLCFHHNQWVAREFFGPEKMVAKQSKP